MIKEIFPSYYPLFRCIADKCKHSCCIGWEIDIDEKTMALYNGMDTDFGKRIRKNIDGDEPHFVLDENERCPFLNENGLCDIITQCTETALCDICRLHPRFKNFFDSFTETCLGLCCEEAARIILTFGDKAVMEELQTVDVTPEEKEFLHERKKVFDILQDREKSIKERFCNLAVMYGLEFEYDLHELCQTYLSLERLDEKWTEILMKLMESNFDGNVFEDEKMQIYFEQLSVYFVLRHMHKGMWDEDYSGQISFVLKSCYIIGAAVSLYKEKDDFFSYALDIGRMYSCEIEYSEENTDILMYE